MKTTLLQQLQQASCKTETLHLLAWGINSVTELHHAETITYNQRKSIHVILHQLNERFIVFQLVKHLIIPAWWPDSVRHPRTIDLHESAIMSSSRALGGIG